MTMITMMTEYNATVAADSRYTFDCNRLDPAEGDHTRCTFSTEE